MSLSPTPFRLANAVAACVFVAAAPFSSLAVGRLGAGHGVAARAKQYGQARR